MLKSLIMGGWFLLLGIPLSAQNIGQDLQKVMLVYGKTKTLALDFDVQVKERPGGDEIEEGRGVIRKSGNQYYSRYGDLERVINDKGSLSLNHGRKTMQLTMDRPETPSGGMEAEAISRLLEAADTVAWMGEEKGMKHYRILMAGTIIPQTEIFIDSENWLIGKIVYHYTPDTESEAYGMDWMEINYSRRELDLRLDKKLFSFATFLKFKGQQAFPQAAYRHYHLDTQTITN